jgi:hypothetical protein
LKRPRKPGCRKKRSVPGRDALGRRRREERRRIEALRLVRDPDPGTGNHRAVAIIQRLLREAREALELSRNGAAEVTGLSRAGIAKFEKVSGCGNINSMLWMVSGYRLRLDGFFVGVWREYLGLVRE